MTVRQIRFDNPSKTSEEFQDLIDSTGVIYDSIVYDSDNTITIITQDTISNIKNLKQVFGLKIKSNVSRKVSMDSNNNDRVEQKIKSSDLS